MKSLCSILALFSLLLFAKTAESRRGAGDYWKSVMKEQPMPKAIGGLIGDHSDSASEKEKANCHESTVKPFVEVKVEVDEEFEPRPNVSAYSDDDSKSKESSVKDSESQTKSMAYPHNNSKNGAEEKSEEDFEPRPNISVYNE